ncbi:calcium-transporting ATpase 1 [Physcia stellaris]|nr:calcium-transporting ATpase 1 [Physcia stellaris]
MQRPNRSGPANSVLQKASADKSLGYSQIRQGIAGNTKGTAFVVYEDVIDAKQACDKLNGFNFQNRYLVVLYHQPEKMAKSKEDLAERQENLEKLKRQHGID